LRRPILAVTLLLFVFLYSFSVIIAQSSNVVTGYISADNSVIVANQAVTLTCIYTSTQTTTGRGTLEMSGPYATSSGPFTSWTTIKTWSSLTSGVPVTFSQQLNQSGYYQFRWNCSARCVHSVYKVVTVQVVENFKHLPEGPAIGVSVMGLAAIAVFSLVVRRKTKMH